VKKEFKPGTYFDNLPEKITRRVTKNKKASQTEKLQTIHANLKFQILHSSFITNNCKHHSQSFVFYFQYTPPNFRRLSFAYFPLSSGNRLGIFLIEVVSVSVFKKATSSNFSLSINPRVSGNIVKKG
jgi:hypothetical protein